MQQTMKQVKVPTLLQAKQQSGPQTQRVKKAAAPTLRQWQAFLLATTFCFSMSGCQQHSTQHTETTYSKTVTTVKTDGEKPQTTASSQSEATAESETIIVPGKSVGTITAGTTLADLQRMFGKANVKAGQMPGPEGTTLPGAILFPDEPAKKLTLYWKEAGTATAKAHSAKSKQAHSNPTVGSVMIDTPHSAWHTEDDVKIGTTLKELEKLNGQPFTLSGFDWDYGGMVLSWGDKGKLREKFQSNGGLGVQLGVPEGYQGNYDTVMGDGSFSSANPAMQKVNPQVTTISVYLQ